MLLGLHCQKPAIFCEPLLRPVAKNDEGNTRVAEIQWRESAKLLHGKKQHIREE